MGHENGSLVSSLKTGSGHCCECLDRHCWATGSTRIEYVGIVMKTPKSPYGPYIGANAERFAAS